MSKSYLDWQGLGKFMSSVLDLFSLAKENLSSKKIGLEIIPWFTGEGKDFFVDFLNRASKQYIKQHPLFKELNRTTMVVNMGSEVLNSSSWHASERVISFCKPELAVLESDLRAVMHLDGQRISFHRPGFDENEVLTYETVIGQLMLKKCLNANIAAALTSRPQYLPHWLNEFTVYFLETIFIDGKGNECVYCLCYDEIEGGPWTLSFHKLKDGFRKGSIFPFVN